MLLEFPILTDLDDADIHGRVFEHGVERTLDLLEVGGDDPMPVTKRDSITTRGGRRFHIKLHGSGTFQVHGSRSFNVKSFCQAFQLPRNALVRMAGYSPRAVADWAAGKPVSTSSCQRLTEISRLCDALGKVVKRESIGRRLEIPNDVFDGSTPLQVIERGESDRLWRMIYHLESGEPG